MPITINNYEVYFVDYHEGLLSPELVAELFLFLEKHLELKEAFETFSEISLETNQETFPSKEQLKRGTINHANLSWFLVADLEGDLNEEESGALNTYLQDHPGSYRDQELFKKTRLEATHEEFREKNSLKKPVPFFVVYRTAVRYAIAAMILLSLIGGSVYLINRSNFTDTERMAQQDAGKEQVPSDRQSLPGYNAPQQVNSDNTGNTNNTGSIPVNPVLASDEIPGTQKKEKQQVNSVKRIIEPNNQEQFAEVSSSEEQMEPIASIPGAGVHVALDQTIQYYRSDKGKISKPATGNDENYMTVWEAIRKVSNREMLRLTGQAETDEPLAYAEQSAPGLAEIVGSGISKLTNDKVTYDSHNDEEGKSGFRFAIGRFAIER